MNLLFKLLLRAGGGAPLRFASSLNRRNTATEAGTATRLKMWVRHRVVIGTNDFADLRLLLSGTVLFGSDAPVGNDVVVEKAAIEKETGGAAFTPVYFGGSRSVTVTNGVAEVISDPVLPSAFSLAEFPRGGVSWVRMLLSVGASKNFPRTDYSTGAGEVCLIHNTITIGISDVDGTGAPSYDVGTGGSGPSDFNFTGQHHCIVIGTPKLSTGKYVIGIGDSIVNGLDDSTGAASYRYGFFSRSLVDADLTSNPLAGCNFGVSGTSANLWTGATVSLGLMKYGNVTVEEFGTNGPQYTQSSAIWAAARTAGHKVIRTKLLTSTTSSDGWATTANQTKTANYTTPTGDRVTFNTTIEAQNGILYDSFVNFDTDVLHTDRDLWKAPGFTIDGLHPTSSAHALMATRLRAAIAALP